MLSSQDTVREAGLDAAALKPREVDLMGLDDLPFSRIVVDFEGAAYVPAAATLQRLADAIDLRVTIPVRADGYDPLGDDSGWSAIPENAGVVLVAGNPAYLSAAERRRRIAPRLAAALERVPDAWVGTEGIERLALATGATQFELLGPDTERAFRDLRTAGFEGGLAVYAPVVLDDDEDGVLDAVGAYAARRRPVAKALPTGAVTNGTATDRTREVLLAACEDYALAGGLGAIRERVDALRQAGADHVVGYPARGLDEFRTTP